MSSSDSMVLVLRWNQVPPWRFPFVWCFSSSFSAQVHWKQFFPWFMLLYKIKWCQLAKLWKICSFILWPLSSVRYQDVCEHWIFYHYLGNISHILFNLFVIFHFGYLVIWLFTWLFPICVACLNHIFHCWLCGNSIYFLYADLCHLPCSLMSSSSFFVDFKVFSMYAIISSVISHFHFF